MTSCFRFFDGGPVPCPLPFVIRDVDGTGFEHHQSFNSDAAVGFEIRPSRIESRLLAKFAGACDGDGRDLIKALRRRS